MASGQQECVRLWQRISSPWWVFSARSQLSIIEHNSMVPRYTFAKQNVRLLILLRCCCDQKQTTQCICHRLQISPVMNLGFPTVTLIRLILGRCPQWSVPYSSSCPNLVAGRACNELKGAHVSHFFSWTKRIQKVPMV